MLDASWFAAAGEPHATRYRRVLAAYERAGLASFDARAAAPAPPARVSVLVPSLDEEDYVEDAVRSLRAQTLVRDHAARVEIVLVDSGSKDATRERARAHVDRVVSAPRGKLTALTLGIRKARGDIIVEADADGWYPPGWLSRMVEPFVDPAVAAVRGAHVYYDSPALLHTWRLRRLLFGSVGNFPGGVRAYRKAAFTATGGFRLHVDQSRFWSLWPEEEWAFRHRLETRGRLQDAREAVCFKSARRNDPLFVRDARTERYRAAVAQPGRFRDGVTDTIYRASRRLAGALTLR
jgi:glycosyltransferase involved in cell wall biosynthesis